MSEDLGRAVLAPDYAGERIPVMEHLSGLSRQAIQHFTGIDPVTQRQRIRQAFGQLIELFEVDLLWGGGIPDESSQVFDWSDGQTSRANDSGDRVVQWGVFGASAQEDGRHFLHIPRAESVDAALEFQPLDYFPQTVEQYRAEFQQSYDKMLADAAGTCLPLPHHYTTCFHWPLGVFGFELLCEAGMDQDRFAALIERFVEITVRVTTAWSQVQGLAGFILHDDLTTSAGPIFSPDWYRRHIFPHYPRIFAPLSKAGVPIIFTSDGDCSMFADDIFEAGADGLNFEYLVDLERLVRDYPDKILIGNINSRTLAAGPIDRIEQEVQQCIQIGSRSRRFVVNVGGQLTHDIPVDHLEAYLTIRRRLARETRQV